MAEEIFKVFHHTLSAYTWRIDLGDLKCIYQHSPTVFDNIYPGDNSTQKPPGRVPNSLEGPCFHFADVWSLRH